MDEEMKAHVQTSKTLGAKAVKLARLAKGLPVLDGGLGESPMPPPPSMVASVREYASLVQYTDAGGFPNLHESLGCSRLLVGNGLKPLLHLVQLALKTLHGDKFTVVHILPAWVSYLEQARLLQVRTASVLPSKGWKVTAADVDKVLVEVKGPHLVIFNNPNNPSGCVYDPAEVKKIAAVFQKHKSIVLADAIYDKIVFKGFEAGDMAQEYPEGTLSGSSLSKTFGCGGYRFGWLAFPEPLEPLRRTCLAVASSVYSCPSPMLQHVAAAALKWPADIQKHVEFQRGMFADLVGRARKAFEGMHVKCSQGRAAWYLLCDFSHYAERLKKRGIHSSEKLNEMLIAEAGLITVTGEAFGIEKPFVLRYATVDVPSIDLEKGTYDASRTDAFTDELRKWLNKLPQ